MHCRKVVFDMDMKNGSKEIFQNILDDLISSLISIFETNKIKPPLDLAKDIALCTLHGEENNIFSAHVVLQRKINRRDSRDLKHIYELLKQQMKSKYYQYINKAFSSHFVKLVRKLTFLLTLQI